MFPFSPSWVASCILSSVIIKDTAHTTPNPLTGECYDPESDTPSLSSIISIQRKRRCLHVAILPASSLIPLPSPLPRRAEPIMPSPSEPAKLGLGRAGAPPLSVQQKRNLQMANKN